MGTRVYDDDAASTSKAVSSLADALRANERRRRTRAAWTYATIVLLGIVATGSVYLAQVAQNNHMNDHLRQMCQQSNAEFEAIKGLVEATASGSSSAEVRAAADETLALLPPPQDCDLY